MASAGRTRGVVHWAHPRGCWNNCFSYVLVNGSCSRRPGIPGMPWC